MDQARTAAAGQEAKLHFLDYWRIIRIRKAVIILVFLLVSVTATFVTYLMQKIYASHARIELHVDSTDISTPNEQPMTGVYDPYFIQTEFEVIRSQTILDRVIDRLDLNEKWTGNGAAKLKTPATRAMLRNMIDLSAVRNTSLIDITVFDTKPDEAALLAQTIAEEYQKYRHEEWAKNLGSGLDALGNEMSNIDEQIGASESNLTELYKTLKPGAIHGGDPSLAATETTLNPQTQMGFNQTIIELKSDVADLEAKLSKLTALNTADQRETIPTVYPDAMLTELLQEGDAARAKYTELLSTLGEKNPEVITAKNMIDENDRAVDGRVNGILKAVGVTIDAEKTKIQALTDLLNEARTNDQETADRVAPYYMARDAVEQQKQLRQVLALHIGEEHVDINMPTASMVKIIDNAEADPNPVKPKKAINIAAGLLIGLLVGFGLAFFIEYLDTSVKTIDDVERTLQSPVLGVIPQNVGYLLDEGAESPHAEAYRVLRTNLLFSRKDDKMNSVAVVSAGAGEGKSTTVCNLATVFAQSGARVLMVDSDLRRPTLHRLLNVANTLGLTNYLLKQNTLEEVIQTTKLPTLDLMASGKLPSSSLGILNSAQMRDLIDNLKGRYDFVFFDSPPIMGVSDASILASEVDMTLQVIQYRRYPQPMNIRAKQLIEKVGGNLIGIVLNNINMAQDESYYYYSGYYHDYYGKNDDETGASANGAGAGKSKVDVKPRT